MQYIERVHTFLIKKLCSAKYGFDDNQIGFGSGPGISVPLTIFKL
jgi:hypothetical protein